MDEAEAAMAERYSLSEEARLGLHLIRLMAEGHRRPFGKGSVLAQRKALEEIAGVFAASR